MFGRYLREAKREIQRGNTRRDRLILGLTLAFFVGIGLYASECYLPNSSHRLRRQKSISAVVIRDGNSIEFVIQPGKLDQGTVDKNNPLTWSYKWGEQVASGKEITVEAIFRRQLAQYAKQRYGVTLTNDEVDLLFGQWFKISR